MKKLIRFCIFSGIVIGTLGIMAVTVIPTGKFLNQKNIEQQTRDDLRTLQDENKDLRRQIRSYKGDSSIEALARGEYNLIYPGQQVFVLLPPD